MAQRPSVRWSEGTQRWVADVRFPDGSRRKVERTDRVDAERDLAELLAQLAKEVAADPRQEQEWLLQNNLVYGALAATGVLMVQPFLTAEALDLPAKICVVAFAVAIPLLAALLMVNRQEVFRRRRTASVLVLVAQTIAQMCAFVGLVAGFWHIWWVAGLGVLVSGLVAVGVHSAGYTRLELDQQPAKEDGEEPGGSAA